MVVATGYFGSPNYIGVPGEDLPHVTHVYREGHEAFDQDVVVVGGGNSAAEAALDLWRSGARVTLVHFGPTFDKKIKPWVLPGLHESREGGEHRRALGQSRVKSHRTRRRRDHVAARRRAAAGRSRLRHDRLRAEHGFAASRSVCRSIRQTGIPAARSGDARDHRARTCSSPASSSRASTRTRCSSRTGVTTATRSSRACSGEARRPSLSSAPSWIPDPAEVPTHLERHILTIKMM